nr:hypothetical protein CFP56_52509 [Quercus suber]
MSPRETSTGSYDRPAPAKVTKRRARTASERLSASPTPARKRAKPKFLMSDTHPPTIEITKDDEETITRWVADRYNGKEPEWYGVTLQERAMQVRLDIWRRSQGLYKISKAIQAPPHLEIEAIRKPRNKAMGPLHDFWHSMHRHVDRNRSQVKCRAEQKAGRLPRRQDQQQQDQLQFHQQGQQHFQQQAQDQQQFQQQFQPRAQVQAQEPEQEQQEQFSGLYFGH